MHGFQDDRMTSQFLCGLATHLSPRPWHRQQMQHPAWQWHNRWWDGKGLSSKSTRIGGKLCGEAMVGGKNMFRKRRIVENSKNIYVYIYIYGFSRVISCIM